MNNPDVRTVLTIAGSDSGGGAGIEADLKTFTALGVFGMAAITSITAQNTCRVSAVHDVPPEIVAQQIDTVAEDIPIHAVKTGMLSNPEIIAAVARSITRNQLARIVVDPVMIAKSGASLLQPSALQTYIKEILPLAYLITPNIPEAERITDMQIRSSADVLPVARKIHELGAKYVLIKGGHFSDEFATDWLLFENELIEFKKPRIGTKNTHGTGCTFSAAIASFLAKGFHIQDAVQQAKNYLTVAIRHSFSLGNGAGPLNHFWILEQLDTTADS